jgi:hypothetical protein
MTIKTQVVDDEKRIITKVVDGKTRISCTCCASAECCMYPADQLGILYTEDDLPDSIEAPIGFGPPGDPPPRGPWVRDGDRFTATFTTDDGEIEAELSVLEFGWTFSNSLGFSANCLLPGSTELGMQTDFFPDELNREGAIGPAARVSQCQWCLEGDELNDGAFTVIYFDGQATTDCNGRFFATSLTPHSWYLAPVGDGLYRKTGNQNTPIGTYEAINTPGLTQEIT